MWWIKNSLHCHRDYQLLKGRHPSSSSTNYCHPPKIFTRSRQEKNKNRKSDQDWCCWIIRRTIYSRFCTNILDYIFILHTIWFLVWPTRTAVFSRCSTSFFLSKKIFRIQSRVLRKRESCQETNSAPGLPITNVTALLNSLPILPSASQQLQRPKRTFVIWWNDNGRWKLPTVTEPLSYLDNLVYLFTYSL